MSAASTKHNELRWRRMVDCPTCQTLQAVRARLPRQITNKCNQCLRSEGGDLTVVSKNERSLNRRKTATRNSQLRPLVVGQRERALYQLECGRPSFRVSERCISSNVAGRRSE